MSAEGLTILTEVSSTESFSEALGHELRARQRIVAPEGTLLLFDYRFTPGATIYTYAALWREGQWWLTGNLNSKRVLTMPELLDLLAGKGDGTVSNVRVVTETKEV